MLTSRREPDAEAQRTIAEITERHKCRIHTFAADVGDEAQARNLVERIRAELPPLAGVAHLAGVLDDALISQQSPERFRTTLAPKAFGAYYLDRLTRNDDLEFFIVYSSASSVIGSPGQANYATANALLDGLVADRRAQGLPATGINWGPWAQGGMATSHAARANLSAQGLIPLDPSAALNALDEMHRPRNRAGNRHQSQLAACREGAGRLPPMDPRPRAAECRRRDTRRQRVPPATARGARRGARQFPHRIPPARSTEFPEARATAGRNQSVPGAGHGFADGGRIQQPVTPQFGGAFTISATAVFDYPTIGSLAEYLAGQVPELQVESGGGTESAG